MIQFTNQAVLVNIRMEAKRKFIEVRLYRRHSAYDNLSIINIDLG